VEVVRQLSRGLVSLQDDGICHADIKPPNILYKFTGEAFTFKLADFNTSKFSTTITAVTGGNKCSGYTEQYASPDQICDTNKNKARDLLCSDDLFSLAVSVFLLLFGEHPFANNARHGEM